ncbi:MAG: hypothetical protein OEV87_08635, partial [Phycisphaerae bacterium]|nr:hypothetical protein [Phycisphaerae bacterium]
SVWSISFAGMVSTPKKTVKPCHCYRTNPKSSLKYNTISSEHPVLVFFFFDSVFILVPIQS